MHSFARHSNFFASWALVVAGTISFLSSSPSWARSPWEVGVSAGQVVGTIQQRESGTGIWQTFNIGGYGFDLGVKRSINRAFTASLGMNVLLDTLNGQVLRQGYELGGEWHLYGGARNAMTLSNEILDFEEHFVQAASLVTRIGTAAYEGSNKDDERVKIKGSVGLIRMGAQWRVDITSRQSIGFAYLLDVYSTPTSLRWLKPATDEISIFFNHEL